MKIRTCFTPTRSYSHNSAHTTNCRIITRLFRGAKTIAQTLEIVICRCCCFVVVVEVELWAGSSTFTTPNLSTPQRCVSLQIERSKCDEVAESARD
jgi:hypothetical protein